VYEPKYDGIRALVDLRAGHVALYSRNGNDKTAQFPAIVTALEALAKKVGAPLLLDGEIVAIDARGRPLGFQQMQGRIHLRSASDIAKAEAQQPAAIVLFDLLRDGDEDVRGLTLAERRLRLQQRVKTPKSAAALIRLSDIVPDDGRAMMARAKQDGWEGLIAKDGQSRYYSDKRTPFWRKLKLLNTEEFVIGGWTEPRETRQHFGALLLGYYEGKT
jgi:bifunctional non-homologous end joining protein LigD